MTTVDFADYELHVEFKAPATTNSGIFLRTPLEPKDPAKDCYELNIAPQDNPFPTGSLVGRIKQTSSDLFARRCSRRSERRLACSTGWDGGGIRSRSRLTGDCLRRN